MYQEWSNQKPANVLLDILKPQSIFCNEILKGVLRKIKNKIDDSNK